MKKTRYYPFERNRYFYGKLLTVRDFESEQKYFNDKRRLMNRLLHGAGVITGLQVIAVDDKSVSVEMGAAIDALGREIIIPSPVTLKLSMMQGFTNNEYAKNVYVCLAYDEKGKEPVHSVANAAVRSDEISEYNRVMESYKLFIREEAPDPAAFPIESLMEQTSVLYQDGQIRVLQKTPRYVNPGDIFEMSICVEKTLQAAKISFEFEMVTQQLLVEGAEADKVSFNEPQDQQETEYEVKVKLRADASSRGKGTIGIKRDNAVLRIGDKQVSLSSNRANEIMIIDGAVDKQWVDDFVNRSLEASLDSPSDPCIYLARISLLQMGPTYMIERVDQVPFNEYVYNASALQKLTPKEPSKSSLGGPITAKSKLRKISRGQAPELKVTFDQQKSELSFDLGLPAMAPGGDEMRTGVVEIPVEALNKFAASPFGRGGKSYVSPEIEHGLGLGNLFIYTGIEEVNGDYISDILSSSERLYYGSADVFKGSEYEPTGPDVKVGTILYPQKGTFRIGVRLQQPTEATQINIRWWAFKKTSDADEARNTIDIALLETASGQEEQQ
ncbi:hypothetical protein [Paenibacillus agricola]|uniref:Uncharacterized protein n=1 Tax=Paenibacillus agricola TaxID=2716264 RepID=A0ABX0JCD1_9BACL|nr:hypothetical protein [Paenibacillus agricola]NHN32413.1 hypothetical protein [Paenibacillus agricola]